MPRWLHVNPEALGHAVKSGLLVAGAHGQARLALGLGAPVFGGGRLSDTGSADAHASTSEVSQATRLAVSLRGLGNVPLTTSLWMDDFDSDKVSATC